MFAACSFHFSDWLTVTRVPRTVPLCRLSDCQCWVHGAGCMPENLCLSGVDVHSVVRRPWYQFIHRRLDLTAWRFWITSVIVVSSMNLCVIISRFRSSIMIRNTRGPSQDPWGIPPCTVIQSEKYPSKAIHWYLLQRKELMQSLMMFGSCNLLSLSMTRLWSMWLNADWD